MTDTQPPLPPWLPKRDPNECGVCGERNGHARWCRHNRSA